MNCEFIPVSTKITVDFILFANKTFQAEFKLRLLDDSIAKI